MIRPLPRRGPRVGFTITEILVVVGIVALLTAVLLASLAGARRAGLMTDSMNNMRQIATWMRLYASDNREHVLPSQIDYSPPQFTNKGFVRSDPAATGNQHEGTWADILWTEHQIGVYPDAVGPLGQNYRYDSPDGPLYELLTDIGDNPLRSRALNSTAVPGGTGPTPFGTGAQEANLPGFYAANDFFNARPDRAGAPPEGIWTVYGQIRAPERSMYLVDCFAGETIGGDTGVADFDFSANPATGVVDFRYSDSCLMLFLDGHVDPHTEWEDLAELEAGRGLRIADPTAR